MGMVFGKYSNNRSQTVARIYINDVKENLEKVFVKSYQKIIMTTQITEKAEKAEKMIIFNRKRTNRIIISWVYRYGRLTLFKRTLFQ